MKKYWAPRKRFSDCHWVALRYLNTEMAIKRVRSVGFPKKEEEVRVEHCSEHGCFHIVCEE